MNLLMTERGFQPQYIQVVRDLYTDCTTVLHLNGETDNGSVPCRRGVKQGCPISPYLFALVMDPLLYHPNQHTAALEIPKSTGEDAREDVEYVHRFGAAAFADDIVIVSETLVGAQSLIDDATNFFQTTGLQVNPQKTIVSEDRRRPPEDRRFSQARSLGCGFAR
jgi:hypothetical protein